MLASSRVALWKIGRYIADEVLENQRRNEDASCISNSSYSPSPTPEMVNNYSADTMLDTLNKWKTDRRDLESLSDSENLIAFNNLWLNSAASAMAAPPAPQLNPILR